MIRLQAFEKIKILRASHTAKVMLGLLIVLLCGDSIPYGIKSLFYTVSLFIKTIFTILVPFILFSCILTTFSKKAANLLSVLCLIFLLIMVNNYILGFCSYIFVLQASPTFLDGSLSSLKTQSALEPILDLGLSSLVDNVYIVIIALAFSLFHWWKRSQLLEAWTAKLSQIINGALDKVVLPAIPLFIFGIALKAQHDGTFSRLSEHYHVFFQVLSFQLIYLTIAYLVVAKLNVRKSVELIKNNIDSGVTGFLTCSSLMAFPLTLKAAIQNTKNEGFSKLVVPFTLNINLSGDTIAISILALSIILGFGLEMPSVSVFAIFILYHSLGRFVCTAIPGGTLLVTLTILEQQLGFTTEMVGVLLAVEAIFDPFVTMTNVLGNGALAVGCDELLRRSKAKKPIFENTDEQNRLAS